MFNLLDAQTSDTTNILISLVVFLLMVFLAYLAAKQYFKERKRFNDEKEIMMDGILSRSAMMTLVSQYASKLNKQDVFSLMFFDIDRFSEYHMAFGAKESNKIIEKVASSLKDNAPKGVKVGRYHGDQFVIFIPTEFDRNKALELAKRFKTIVERPIALFGDTEIKLTVSIGVVHYPMHGSYYPDLMESLKIVLYIIKKSGGNAVRVYTQESDQKEAQYVDYYYQLKSAIQQKEFQLYYQPIINAQTEELYGLEALLRWNHPEFGILAPYKFLSIMEESGDIHWIGEWGLETIIKTQQELSKLEGLSDIKLSINLSPRQLMSEALESKFQTLLRKYKTTGEHFILEIIEFALFDQQETIIENIRKLKNLGFKIAIDGFGLDYQTISKLERFNVDVIKLDNEFLLEKEAYLKAKFAELLVEFAKSNAYEIICEQIENNDMKEAALTYKINLLQGYHYSKAMHIDDLKNFLKDSAWKTN